MLYFISVLLGAMGSYLRCPSCKKVQRFKGEKKGAIVKCKKCGHEFVLQ
jgi:ribosomal protein L37AE/L43A